jgi:CRP-like cAMP-binding protein/thioredoxin reductase/Fe-S-cluster-containing hydrogenase component 2
MSGDDIFEIAIVGSGPGGIAAATRSAARGVSHVLLERTGHLSDTIYKYQRRKHVMATPDILPLRADVGFAEGSRETVLETWDRGVEAAGCNVRLNAEVVGIKGERGDFRLTLADRSVVRARAVVLAIGLQGNLRKLTVPGAELPSVQYQLDDPDEFQDEHIVVVGTGDAGIENALVLSNANTVTILNRGAEYPNAKPANVQLLQTAIADGRMQAMVRTAPKRLEPGWMTVDTADGETRIRCDRVIARLGALPPRKFVESCGIVFGSDSPSAFPVVSDHYESNVPGLYIIGALAGYPLIKQCMNQGYEVVEYILGNPVAPADEPLIQAKLDAAQPGLVVSPFIATIREQVPVFAELSPLQIREFLLTSEVHLAAPGQKIFERNDYTNSFYAIIDGSVEVLIGEAGAPANPVLRGGEFFGEIGLLSGRRRGATVIARDGALLLEVPRNTMLRLQRSVPSVARAIDEVAIVRVVKSYLGQDLDSAILAPVIREAEMVSLKAGEILIQEGATDDAMYLIRSGSVLVSRMVGGQEVVLTYLAAGNYVGEMALLRNAPRTASVKAAVATQVIKLPAAAVRDLLDAAPELRRRVEEKFSERVRSSAHQTADSESGALVNFLMREGLGEATDVLLIDETLCIRCDNCEKACAETHDRISRLDREAGATFASIHVPTSCRHCEHPSCMKDCPPDAIRRAPSGEVTIADTCIGCGNCERNCPYGVIKMAAPAEEKPGLLSWLFFGRGPGPGENKAAKKHHGGESSRKKAVKCDMCHGIEGGAACVRACPTGAAIRVRPEEYVAMIRRGGAS